MDGDVACRLATWAPNWEFMRGGRSWFSCESQTKRKGARSHSTHQRVGQKDRRKRGTSLCRESLLLGGRNRLSNFPHSCCSAALAYISISLGGFPLFFDLPPPSFNVLFFFGAAPATPAQGGANYRNGEWQGADAQMRRRPAGAHMHVVRCSRQGGLQGHRITLPVPLVPKRPAQRPLVAKARI